MLTDALALRHHKFAPDCALIDTSQPTLALALIGRRFGLSLLQAGMSPRNDRSVTRRAVLVPLLAIAANALQPFAT
jgi:hypothetical protein